MLHPGLQGEPLITMEWVAGPASGANHPSYSYRDDPYSSVVKNPNFTFVKDFVSSNNK